MANSRFLAQVSKILVGIYVFSIILEPKIFALAGDEDAAAATNSSEANAGVSPQSKDDHTGGNGGVEVSQLCNTELQTFLPPPYGNVSHLVCKPIWNTFILRVSLMFLTIHHFTHTHIGFNIHELLLWQYLQREDHVMTIILSAIYTTGWVGIGFSKDGMMAGSSAMVGWFNKKGQPRIKQFYLQGTRQSQVIADKGELPLANVPPVVAIHGAMIYLAFQLKFDHRIGRQPIILAFGTRYPHHFHLSHHDDRRTIMFDFSGGLSFYLIFLMFFLDTID